MIGLNCRRSCAYLWILGLLSMFVEIQDMKWPQATNLVCDHYYGLGVENAWACGYSGKNVTVAILDVGVNVDLDDLKQNIDIDRSYNYIDNNTNVKPEYNWITYYGPDADHGNKISSIVAATKGNNRCSTGIAFNATLFVRKIFKVTNENGHFTLSPNHWVSSDIFARAIQDCIDVSVMIMAWSPEMQYDILNQSMDMALRKAATKGRNGRGTLLFVPSGPVGNGLANTIYTITVGGMSKGGGIHKETVADASVITSGLFEGNDLTSSKMVTTTENNGCVSSFKGVSAATAQVSAIAALTLEANRSLSMRDVKHILVQSSDHTGLKESIAFNLNGAGHYFHGFFGFGLVNALNAVTLAETWEPVTPLFTRTLIDFQKSSHSSMQVHYIFPYHCVLGVNKSCLANVEEVKVTARLILGTKNFGMEIRSPHGTRSVLVDPSEMQKVPGNLTNVSLLSVHFWGEDAIGNWKVVMQFKDAVQKTEVDIVSLTLYGTGIGDPDEAVSHDTSTSATTETPVTIDNKPKNTGNVLLVSHKAIAVISFCFLICSMLSCICF